MKSCNEVSFKRRPTVVVMAIVSCLFALTLSCSESKCPSTCDVIPLYPRPSANDLIEFFAGAYEEEDIEKYSVALSEFFEFEFTPDVADSLGLPEETPWWGKTDDIASTENMFGAPEVPKIQIDLDQSGSSSWESVVHRHIGPDGDDPGDEPDTTEIEGLGKEFEPDIKVWIDRPDEDVFILWVNNSLLDIWVAPDPDSPGHWVILRIKEMEKPGLALLPEDPGTRSIQTQSAASEPSTWGGIKSMFR